MSLLWALPFAGILLSIATGPLLFPHLWEHHVGKFAAFWSACVIVPLVIAAGFTPASHAVLHTLILEYIPFILLLLALFVAAGGIYLEGNLRGTPAANAPAAVGRHVSGQHRRHHRRLDDPDPAADPRQ